MSSVNETPLTFSEWTSYLEKLEEMRKTINDWYLGNSAIETLASERQAYEECKTNCSGSLDVTQCENDCKDEHLKHQWNLPIFSRDTSIKTIGDYFRFTQEGGGGTLDTIAQNCYEKDGVPILPDFDAYKKVIKSSSTPIGFFQEFKEEGSSQTYVGVPKTSQLVKGINNYVILIDKPNTNGCCLMAGVDTTESYTFELGNDYLYSAQGNFSWFDSYVWYKAQSVSFPLFRDDTRLDLLSVLPSDSQQSTDYTEVRRPIDLVAPIFSIKPAFGAEITKMQSDDANACQKDSIILKSKKIVSGATIFTLRGVAARLGSNWIATIPPDMKFWMWSWHLIELLFKTLVPCYLFEQHGGSSSITTQFCKPSQRRNLQVLTDRRDVWATEITDPDLLAPCAGSCLCVRLFQSTQGDCICDNNDGNLSCNYEPESTECRQITPSTTDGSWQCGCGHRTESWVTRICAIDNDQRCTIQSTALWCPKYVTTTNMDTLCNLLKNGNVTTETFYESYIRQDFDRKETTIDTSECGGLCTDTGVYEDIVWKYENYETNANYMNSKIVTRVETPDLFSVISASTLYLSDEWAKHMCVGSAMKLIKQAVKVWDCIKEKFIGREQLIDGKKEPELQLGYSCGTMVNWDPTLQVNKPVLPIYRFDIASKQVIDDCSCYGKGSDCIESLFSETSSCNLEDESSVKIVSVYDPSKTNVILKFNFSE